MLLVEGTTGEDEADIVRDCAAARAAGEGGMFTAAGTTELVDAALWRCSRSSDQNVASTATATMTMKYFFMKQKSPPEAETFIQVPYATPLLLGITIV